MKRSKSISLATLAILATMALLGVGGDAVAEDETSDLPQNFSARTVNMQGGRGINVITLEIRQWTTQGQREALFGKLVEKGSEPMTNLLRTYDSVGSIRLPNTRAHDLRYAREVETDDGRQIVVALDRPIGGAELYTNARSLEHGVTLVAFNLPADGSRGEGTFIVGAELEIKDDKLSIETASLTPLRLNNARQTN